MYAQKIFSVPTRHWVCIYIKMYIFKFKTCNITILLFEECYNASCRTKGINEKTIYFNSTLLKQTQF